MNEVESHVAMLSVAKVGASGSSLRIVSRILQTTDVRLVGLNYLGSVVRGVFATGLTVARCQSSGTWAVWNDR